MADAPASGPLERMIDDIADGRTLPVRRIGMDDVRTALRRGFDDFWEMPTHGLFASIVIVVLGFVLVRASLDMSLIPLVFPLLAGFALLGPVAAVGIYELSRRREKGEDTQWFHIFDVLRSPALGTIVGLGIVLLLVFAVWLQVAYFIYLGTMAQDVPPASLLGFIALALGTPGGWAMIIIGNIVGAVFALVAFAISVVSFPLILDRHLGLRPAVATSVKAVITNPVPMIAWGVIVAVGLALAALPLLLGLIAVLPTFGHATWHLYRRLIP